MRKVLVALCFVCGVTPAFGLNTNLTWSLFGPSELRVRNLSGGNVRLVLGTNEPGATVPSGAEVAVWFSEGASITLRDRDWETRRV